MAQLTNQKIKIPQQFLTSIICQMKMINIPTS